MPEAAGDAGADGQEATVSGDADSGTQAAPAAQNQADDAAAEVEIEWQADAPPELGSVTVAQGDEARLESGKSVEIVGTPKNGSVGLLEEFLAEKGRWKVRFASGTTNNFKVENLRVLKGISATAAASAAGPAAVDAVSQEESDRVEAGSEQKPVIQVGLLTETLKLMKKSNSIRAAAADEDDEDALLLPRRKAPIQPAAPKAAPAKQKKSTTVEPKAAVAPSNAADDGGEAQEHGGDATEETEGVYLAGMHFPTQRSLVEHMKAVQARMDAAPGEDGKQPTSSVLEGTDMFLFYHLVMQHPKLAEKVKAPLQAIRYGIYQKMKNKCFMLVFADGSEEPVSWNKSAKELFSQRNKRALPDDAEQEEAPRKRAKTGPEELSRQEKGLRLISEEAKIAGAPTASRWEYPLMDEGRRCFAGFLANQQPEDVLSGFYEKVLSGTVWMQPIDPRSQEPIPRKTAWMVTGNCTCSYRYGGVDVEPQQFPGWMHELLEVYMPLCGINSRNNWPNSCNLNLYKDGGMSVGWHADDEKLFGGKKTDIRIISLSLGCTRTFELRLAASDVEEDRGRCSMKLAAGDLCTMEGLTQKYYQHRVPKEDASGARLNLTWRWITNSAP